ncbi:hypothetical protein [Pleionea mediterranea]|uniref:DUF2384 domain-containing protein n=1 Tax=Pleionea mediterranea TaxID=523701 RepID=A0A316FYN6_9GAMM|nr:hypothetical protein [Pleionea mediterranea]PWK52816.1 hypothetical protein C8D97_10434 [Pleionea mediterranea]
MKAAKSVKATEAPKITPEHVSAAIRWLSDVSRIDKWNLSISDQALLLGVKERTYKSWKKKASEGQGVEVSKDTQDRLSYLLGIMKGLKMISPMERGELVFEWFSSPNKNPVFNGKSIRDYLLENGSMISLHNTRSYLDAARGA